MTKSTDRRPSSRKAKLATAAVALFLLLPLVAFRVPAQNQSEKSASAPEGWILAGSNPANYKIGIDPQASYQHSPSAYLKSVQSAGDGFGTLMQEFSAKQYAGKRLRLRASIRTSELSDWAGLWMRVDKGSSSAAFDNMMNRPLRGTTGWQNYDVVLGVPQDATGIAFGVLLSKSGAVWLNNVKFETVGNDVPTTGPGKGSLPQGPTNLNFEK